MEFGIKMYFLWIKRTGHLIQKKVGGLKCTSLTNLKASLMLPVYFTSVPCLSIQSSFPRKMPLGANFGFKSLSCAKKIFKDQIEIFLKKSML